MHPGLAYVQQEPGAVAGCHPRPCRTQENQGGIGCAGPLIQDNLSPPHTAVDTHTDTDTELVVEGWAVADTVVLYEALLMGVVHVGTSFPNFPYLASGAPLPRLKITG